MTELLLIAAEVFCATIVKDPPKCFTEVLKCAAVNGSYETDKNPTQIVAQCELDYIKRVGK